LLQALYRGSVTPSVVQMDTQHFSGWIQLSALIQFQASGALSD